MLVFNESINGVNVASVQASHRIGAVQKPIINPRNLSIIALYVETRMSSEPRVLFTSDVRSITPSGMIIDHDEQLMETEDLVRLKEIIDLNFVLVGKRVETEDGRRLGKVSRYIFDNESWLIMKLSVSQSLAKNFSSSGLIVSRSQIVKVTDSRIVVKSTAQRVKSGFSWRRLLFGSAKPALTPDTTDVQ